MKNQIEAIRGALGFLIKYVMAIPDYCTENEKQISANIQSLARKAVSLKVMQFQGDDVTERQAMEMKFVLSVLLEMMKLIDDFLLQGGPDLARQE